MEEDIDFVYYYDIEDGPVSESEKTDKVQQEIKKQIEKNEERTRVELQQKEQRLESMMTVEEYNATAEKIHKYWKRVYTGWGAMKDMGYRSRKYLIDLMFDGVDEDGSSQGCDAAIVVGPAQNSFFHI